MRHAPPMPLLRCAHILFLALILPLAGIGPLLVSSARADVIELRADPWCPFNCTPGSAAPGFMVELAREALAPFGHEVRYAQLNWSRSLVKVRSGEITRISELAGLRLGATRDYDYYTTEVLAHIAARSPERSEIQLLSGNDALARNLRKLLAGRIDVMVEEHSALLYQLQQLGLQDQVVLLPHAQSSPLHIGFSSRHPRPAFYVRQMEQGLATLRRSGRYRAILARYGLKG